LPPQAVKNGTPQSITVCVPAPGKRPFWSGCGRGHHLSQSASGSGCHPRKKFDILDANSAFWCTFSQKITPATVQNTTHFHSTQYYMHPSSANINKSSEVADARPRPQQTWTENWGGGYAPFAGGARSPSNTMWPGPRSNSVPSDGLHPSSRLATVDMDRKLRGCAPFRGKLRPHLT